MDSLRRYSIRIVVLTIVTAVGESVAPAQSTHLYWTEYRYSATDPEARFNELFSVHRANVADVAGTQEELIHQLPYQPAYGGLGAAYSAAYVRPFGHTSGVDTYNFAPETFVYSMQAAMEGSGTPIDAAGTSTFFYLRDGGGIYRGDFEFENRSLLVPLPDYIHTDIALDESRGHIYWLGTCGGCGLVLGRANLDGSEVQSQVLPVLADDYPADLAIDAAAGKLYWNDLYGSSIRRADLDGTNIETVLSDVVAFSISVDPTPIPEPTAWILALIGGGLSVGARFRRRRWSGTPGPGGYRVS